MNLCQHCGIYIGKHLRQWLHSNEVILCCEYCNGETHPTNPENHKPKLYN